MTFTPSLVPNSLERELLGMLVAELGSSSAEDLPPLDIEAPEPFEFLVEKEARYKVLYGGRGGAKSWQIARSLLKLARERRLRILCTRELQVTIKDSVHRLLSDQIELLGLSAEYDVQRATIRHNKTRSEFLFRGLRHNVDEIKSLEGIDICWVEEAESVSETSWTVLIPTVRKDGSEIWVSFNTGEETDPTYRRFVDEPPPDAIVKFVTFEDNPFLPEVLKQEEEYLRRVDPDAHAHVWLGQPWVRSKAQVLDGKWEIEEFEPDEETWNGPYFGSDFGFASSPTTLVRLWVADSRLLIEHEAGGVGEDNPENIYREVPGYDRHVIRADSARPETISQLSKPVEEGGPGLRVEPASKWAGSVKDGIAFLRRFEQIIIHPRCKETAREARLWRYKTDPLTGDVVLQLVDANNHYWDAVRYALDPLIRISVQKPKKRGAFR